MQSPVVGVTTVAQRWPETEHLSWPDPTCDRPRCYSLDPSTSRDVRSGVSADLSKFTRADLRRNQDSLNDRPRKTLGFLKPVEKLSELAAPTA